jgi:2-dehydro-3-deoxygalactonokinase
VPATALPSYLSGLLIGSELGAAQAMRPGTRTVCLLGGAALVGRYTRACALAGLSSDTGAADCAATGMARILAASPAP